ncbi:hypothetical protein SprV_0902693200 [Sparganum proliferum]
MSDVGVQSVYGSEEQDEKTSTNRASTGSALEGMSFREVGVQSIYGDEEQDEKTTTPPDTARPSTPKESQISTQRSLRLATTGVSSRGELLTDAGMDGRNESTGNDDDDLTITENTLKKAGAERRASTDSAGSAGMENYMTKNDEEYWNQSQEKTRTSQAPSTAKEGSIAQFNVSSARNSLTEEQPSSASSCSTTTTPCEIRKESFRIPLRSFRLVQGTSDCLGLPRTPPCSVERRKYNAPSLLEVPHNSRASSPHSSAAESSASPSPKNISLRFPKKTGEQSGDNSPTKLNRPVVPASDSVGKSPQRATSVKTFKLTRTPVDASQQESPTSSPYKVKPKTEAASSSKLRLKIPDHEAVKLEKTEEKPDTSSTLVTEQITGDTPPQIIPRGANVLGNYRNLETLLKYHRLPKES